MRSPPTPRPRRGYALPAVLLIAFVATTIAATLLARLSTSMQTTTDILHRRQAFYAAEGMTRLVIKEVEGYLLENRNPSAEELMDEANIPRPTLPGFTLVDFSIAPAGDTFDGPIPNGPFRGMFAQQKPIDLHLSTRRDGSEVVGDIDLRVNLGHISLFQFFVFADEYIEIYPGATMTINPGRVHANADLCMGATTPFQVEKVTSAERILAGGTGCRRENGNGFHIWDGSAYEKMTPNNANGCVDCDHTGLDWSAYALDVWKGNVQDRAHGVPSLRLPVRGSTPTQAGQDAGGNLMINGNSLRMLVDPVQPGDPDKVREQRYAWKADLRIIDGVWYLNDGTWPGQPIWSDHPGSYVTRDAEGLEGGGLQAVGQADLAARYGWTTPPRRYSFYEYQLANQSISADPAGVISYGSLFRQSATSWVPGFWATGPGTRTTTDVDTLPRGYFCDGCNGATCNDAVALRDSTVAYCQHQDTAGVWQSQIASQYLQATRGGFTDHRIRAKDPTYAAILPINFDVAQFAAALQDTSPGELGSWFEDRPFNGIVYIAGSWPGVLSGMPDERAPRWPAQGALSDLGQAATYNTTRVHRALPRYLCSDSLGYVPGVVRTPLSGPASNLLPTDGYEPWFVVPSCSDAVSPAADPNAVRIINAATLDPATFPAGLSIVTHLPMYMLGDANTGSMPAGDADDPWLPFMVGADAVVLLSRAWNDNASPWSDTNNSNSRTADTTQWNFQYIGGIVQTVDANAYSGGIENYPRFMEKWAGKSAIIRGSLVVGFNSIYNYYPWNSTNTVYAAPSRDWGFDPHLRILSNQPPGAPMMAVHSISRMERR